MKIPDLSVTDLVKNIIGLLVIATTLLLYIQELAIPVQLDIAFWAVMVAYGFSAVKPVVSNILSKAYGKPPSPNPDK
jgi:hypothetical protein